MQFFVLIFMLCEREMLWGVEKLIFTPKIRNRENLNLKLGRTKR